MKKLLRKEIAQTLKLLSQNDLHMQSESVTAQLINLDQYKKAKSIGFYMNMDDSEIKTGPMIKHAFESGKKVYLPRCSKGDSTQFRKNHLVFYQMQSYNDVLALQPQGKWMLKEPAESCVPLETGLDLLVVPGVAFSTNGKRLGHGAGYYDDFINRQTTLFHRPALVGVCLREQIREDIPLEAHDQLLDVVLYPENCSLK